MKWLITVTHVCKSNKITGPSGRAVIKICRIPHSTSSAVPCCNSSSECTTWIRAVSFYGNFWWNTSRPWVPSIKGGIFFVLCTSCCNLYREIPFYNIEIKSFITRRCISELGEANFYCCSHTVHMQLAAIPLHRKSIQSHIVYTTSTVPLENAYTYIS